MQTCDVLIVGGGPAGSSCAWRLRDAGLDVVVMDRATFPRDKVCAGWITPQVVDALRLNLADYGRGRTLQPITGFKVGLISGRDVELRYPHAVSFGIRRCEFDQYLLERSGARTLTGTAISSIRFDAGRWIVNEAISASMLVGAGGHFCPVARTLNPGPQRTGLVAAQEAEFPLTDDEAGAWNVRPDTPELHFCGDLKGYGWCFRKNRYLNVGLGRIDGGSLTAARDAFVAFLGTHRRVSATPGMRWRGHAYLVSNALRPVVIDSSVLLAGDAAGLAYPESGEGIRPAIESGLMAADVIAGAAGRYTRERLESYERRLRDRFGAPRGVLSRTLPPGFARQVFPRLIGIPWFVRHLVLDRWFLHSNVAAL
jgi:geranylgeranyl reductase family protein